MQTVPQLTQFVGLDPEELQTLSFQPARVKWFDLGKGYGFANAFGRSDDVFIHVEVLRASGLASLEGGEAVALRIIDGERGGTAVELAEWSRSS